MILLMHKAGSYCPRCHAPVLNEHYEQQVALLLRFMMVIILEQEPCQLNPRQHDETIPHGTREEYMRDSAEFTLSLLVV